MKTAHILLFVCIFFAVHSNGNPSDIDHRRPGQFNSLPMGKLTTPVDSSTNWVNTLYYSDVACAASMYNDLMSQPTTLCRLGNSPGDYVQLSCTPTSNEITVSHYSDSSCTNFVTSDSVLTGVCMSEGTDDDYAVSPTGAPDMLLFTCTTGYPTALPPPSGSRSVYSSPDCTESSLIQYESAFTDYCYDNSNGTSFNSHMLSYPYVYMFNQLGCNPAMITEVNYLASGVCVDNVIVNFYLKGDDDNSSNNGALSTNSKLIVASVVGVIGTALLVSVVWYFFSRPSTGAMSKQGDSQL